MHIERMGCGSKRWEWREEWYEQVCIHSLVQGLRMEDKREVTVAGIRLTEPSKVQGGIF